MTIRLVLVHCIRRMKKQLELERCNRMMLLELVRCNRMMLLVLVRCKLVLVRCIQVSMKEQVSSLKLYRSGRLDQLATYRTDQLVHQMLKQKLPSKRLGLQLKIDSSEPP